MKVLPRTFLSLAESNDHITMAITILAPAPAAIPYHEESSSDDSDDGGADLQEDINMRPAKRARKDIVTPGETVTDDPQWMRFAFPTLAQIFF